MKYKRWIKYIDSHEIISFDIFDTILVRNCSSSNVVFDIVGKKINDEHFKSKRLLAESFAMRKYNKTSPTIDEIYSDFYDEKTKEIEIDTEKRLLQSNKDIKDLYDYCVSKNKKIIFISDMYLSEQILKDILIDKGYKKFHKIYVSCEYDKTKINGELFKFVIKDLKVNPKTILHIGDSFKSDFLMARINKIASLCCKKIINRSNYENLNNDILTSFIFNNAVSIEENSISYKYGFEKFGIFLFCFTNWLRNELKKNNIKKVYFLSRDGYILKKVFDIFYSDFETHYLYVSRRSLMVPTIWMNDSFSNLKSNIIVSNYFDIKTFIKRLGLNPDKYSNIYTKLGISDTEEFDGKNFIKDIRLKKFYNIIKKDVVNNSKSEYEILVDYLKQNNFCGNIAIVDIGWHGTMQKKLEKICAFSNLETKIHGFYIGQEKIINNGTGFLFNGYDNLLNKITISGSFGLFESFFLATHGTVINYKKSKEVTPNLAKYEFSEYPDNLKIIHDFQYGGVSFCEKIKSIYKLLDDFNFCVVYDSFEQLRKLLVNPNFKEVKYFGNIIFNDTYNSKLLETKSILYYIFHIKQFKKDFYKSTWKIGFLKKVFVINIPFFKIYYARKVKEKML